MVDEKKSCAAAYAGFLFFAAAWFVEAPREAVGG